MPFDSRTAFQQDVVNALIESKAIDLEAVGSVLGKFGESAAIRGETVVTIINRRAFWCCGWPGPDIGFLQDTIGQPGA